MFRRLKILLALYLIIFSFPDFIFSQAETENPVTWKYFRISARTTDDSLFIKLQDDLLIDPKLESYLIIVNIIDNNPLNQYLVIGDENTPDAPRYSWSQLSKSSQEGLIKWTGSNKENLNRKKLNYGSVFLDVIKKIRIKEAISPPKNQREILNTTAYISPYMQLFGGEKVGIPLKRSFGFTFGNGTRYSGPFECDAISFGMNLLGANISFITRIKEFNTFKLDYDTVNRKYKSDYLMKQYNNIFFPSRGLQISYVIPFGNFLELGYYTDLTDNGASPSPYTFYMEGDTNKPLYNNVISGKFFFWEFRYPLRLLSSTVSKIYIANYANEFNFGISAREMRVAGAVFDFRTNFTLRKVRNSQLLIEALVSNIGEGFSLSSFAFGPSVRLSCCTESGKKIGVITLFFNIRLKLGDYFEEK